jgi:hypothetical protein
MEGARAPKFRPYWIRYIVAFWAGEKLSWARDNLLIACACSLAPGLIAAGISAALSDHKWRAAAYASLLTYGGLFALFLMWRLVATPLELDLTHDLHSAKTIADRLALLNEGNVVIEGSFEELQRSDIEFVREFLGHS